MLKFRSIFALTAVATAIGLTACGGGDDIKEVTAATADATVAVSAATLESVRATTTAMGTAAFPIESALVFARDTGATGATADATAPAGSTLTLSPPTAAGEVAKFAIASSAADAVEGDVTAGSCVFTPRVVRGTYSSIWEIGRAYRVGVCNIVLPTRGLTVGVPTPVIPRLTLGTRNLTTSVPITVQINNGGGVVVNNTNVSNVPVVTTTGSGS